MLDGKSKMENIPHTCSFLKYLHLLFPWDYILLLLLLYYYIIVNIIFLQGASCHHLPLSVISQYTTSLVFNYSLSVHCWCSNTVEKSYLQQTTEIYSCCYELAIRPIYRIYISTLSDRFIQDSIMSLDISFSLVSRCLPNSSSGQWRSLMKVCRASSFQKRSSDVPEPLLQEHKSEFNIFKTTT